MSVNLGSTTTFKHLNGSGNAPPYLDNNGVIRRRSYAGDTLYVSPDHVSANPFYYNLTTAISAASAGDLIVVYPGTYNERISVTKNLNFYFYPGAVINPSDDTNTTIFNINDGGGTTIGVNIDGHLTIRYNAGSNIPQWLVVGNAWVNLRMRAFEGAAGTNGAVLHVDSMSARLHAEFDSINDGYVDIDDASHAHIRANIIDNIKLYNSTSYIDANAIAGLINIDGGINYISSRHISGTADIDGGTTIFRSCNFDNNYDGDLIDVNVGAATAKFFDCRIKNTNTTNTNSCIRLSGTDVNPVILRNCTLIKASGNYSIVGMGDVYNFGTICNWSGSAAVRVSGEALQVDSIIVDEF